MIEWGTCLRQTEAHQQTNDSIEESGRRQREQSYNLPGRMNVVKSLFLRAKPWQLFIVFAAIATVIFLLPSGKNAVVSTSSMIIREIVFSTSILVVVGWFWSVGSFVSGQFPPPHRRSSLLFKVACLYTLFYIPSSVAFFPDSEPLVTSIPQWLGVLYILCFYYIFYRICRGFAVLERGRAEFRLKYIGMFLSLWFFPVGVWIIQPRINRLIQRDGLTFGKGTSFTRAD